MSFNKSKYSLEYNENIRQSVVLIPQPAQGISSVNRKEFFYLEKRVGVILPQERRQGEKGQTCDADLRGQFRIYCFQRNGRGQHSEIAHSLS